MRNLLAKHLPLLLALCALGCGSDEPTPVDLSCNPDVPRVCCGIDPRLDCIWGRCTGGGFSVFDDGTLTEDPYWRCEDPPSCPPGIGGFAGCVCDKNVPPPSAQLPISLPLEKPAHGAWSAVAAAAAAYVLGESRWQACNLQSLRFTASTDTCCRPYDARSTCSYEGDPYEFLNHLFRKIGLTVREGPPRSLSWPGLYRQEIANNRPVVVAIDDGSADDAHYYLVVGYGPGEVFRVVDADGYKDVPAATLAKPRHVLAGLSRTGTLCKF